MGFIKLLDDKKKNGEILFVFPIIIAAYLFSKAVIPFDILILITLISAILVGFMGSISFYLVNKQYFFQRELKLRMGHLSKIYRLLFIAITLVWILFVIYLEYLAMTFDTYSAILSIIYLYLTIELVSSLCFFEILRFLFEREDS